MIIKKVDNKKEAIECDKLLTKLIMFESNINENIKPNYEVYYYFTERYEKENNALFIALMDETIVGYSYVKITSSPKSPELEMEALIDGLFVLEEHRKEGIGTKLINESKKWAKDIGAKYIKISVLDKNINAKNLYIKGGFKEFISTLRQEL